MEFEAVAVLTSEAVKRLPSDIKVIGTRWVHTGKNAKQRAAGGRFRDVPTLAKSRLAVQGCQEYTYIRSDSPTASLLVVNLLCSVAAAKRWHGSSAPLTPATPTSSRTASNGCSCSGHRVPLRLEYLKVR